LYMSGNAVLQTARELRARLAPIAASMLEASEADLEFADNHVGVGGAPQRRVAWAAVVAESGRRGVSPAHLATFHAEEAPPVDLETGQGRTFPDYTFGCHAVDVEVDTETGAVRLLKYAASHDVGRAINPQSVEGQIQGGAAMGLGQALTEEVAVENGNNVTTLFANYLIPTSLDLPDLKAVVVESGEGKGPFQARGIGEPPTGPPPAAVASAIENACGVRLRDLPMTPERILEALRAHDAAASPPASTARAAQPHPGRPR
jgi:CO/xanthine dehydrogenase Mo-binding subunit